MMIYQLLTNPYSGLNSIKKTDGNKTTIIPFDLDNTDYQNFKEQINEEKAQLQDADGNTMSAEDAKAYVATLP